MEPPGATEKSVEVFSTTCLNCHKPPRQKAYTCNCSEEDWRKQYRSLDIGLDVGSGYWKQKIRTSFNNYRFDHPHGILQYKALPHRKYGKEILKTGLTPLYRLKNIGHILKTGIYIKSEGHNPSGCFKDRETLLCLLNARHRGLSKTTIYSSGNAAASAAIFAQKNAMHLITFVSGDTYPEKIDFITTHGSDVIVIGDENTNFETGYRFYARLAAKGIYIQNDYDNWSVVNPYRVQGDKTTAVEIVKQLSSTEKVGVPDYVVVPTANGSCLTGMWKGFKELFDAGVADRLPRMISVGIRNASPIYKAVEKKQLDRPVVCDLSGLEPEDADIGSIIVAEEGYDSIEAARAVVASGGLAIEVTKKDIEETLQMFLEEETDLARDKNILPEPASLISIAAVRQLRKQVTLEPWHCVVSVITGSGVKSRQKIEELAPDTEDAREMVEDIMSHKMKKQYPEARKQGRVVKVEASLQAIAGAFDQLKK